MQGIICKPETNLYSTDMIYRLLIATGLTLATQFSFAQQASCCQPSGRAFAALGADKEFVDAHTEPGEAEGDYIGKMIRIDIPGEAQASAYVIRHNNETNKYLLVYHEWWGLNDHIKEMADRLYKDLGDVHVIALDLYDGKVATTREAASELMGGLNYERAGKIIAAAQAMAMENSENKARFLSIGWCMGGGYSLESALQAGEAAEACVMYYGMPEKNLERLEKLNAPVLFVFAEQDKWINAEVVGEFRKNMGELNKSLKVVSYNAVHAFANPSNPDFDREASEDAYRKVLAFLRKTD